MNEALLRLFVAAQTEIYSRKNDEDGAETVQVVMIMGIMAIIVTTLFFLPQVGLKQAIINLGNTVKSQLTGAGNQTSGLTP